MPSDGPSKEELDYYFKNSRKYFDELANYYMNADPEYYKKFIAPYYSSFVSVSSSGKPGSARALVSVIAAGVVALGIAGVAFFLVQSSDNSGDEPEIKKIEKTSTKKKEPAIVPADTTSAIENEKSDYEKGVQYFNEKNFSRAEQYLKRVPKDDENYEDAHIKLNEIHEFKRKDDNRQKPIERIR